MQSQCGEGEIPVTLPNQWWVEVFKKLFKGVFTLDLDYKHVINEKINGCDISIFFTNQHNPKIKEIVLNTLIDNYEKRIQDYIESTLFAGLQKECIKV